MTLVRQLLLTVFLFAGVVAPSFSQTQSEALASCQSATWAAEYSIIVETCSLYLANQTDSQGATYWAPKYQSYRRRSYDNALSGKTFAIFTGDACPAPKVYNAATKSCDVPPAPACEAADLGWQFLGPSSSGDYCVSGCTEVASFVVDGSSTGRSSDCFTNPDGSTYGCYYSVARTTATCSTNNAPVILTPPANSVAPSVQCPSGYISVDGSTVCTTPSTAGTTSTPTTAGTPASSPSSFACPVGYHAVDNSCVSSAPPSSHGCPVGATLNASGLCESLANIPVGDATKTGNCGAPGQPACVTTDKSLLDSIKELFGFKTSDMTSIQDSAKSPISFMDNISNAGYSPSHGWTKSLPSLFPQAATCAPWVFHIGGGDRVINPCPTADKIRSIAEYCLYVLTVFGLFRILFGTRQISYS